MMKLGCMGYQVMVQTTSSQLISPAEGRYIFLSIPSKFFFSVLFLYSFIPYRLSRLFYFIHPHKKSPISTLNFSNLTHLQKTKQQLKTTPHYNYIQLMTIFSVESYFFSIIKKMFIRRESKKKNTVANSHRSVKEISTLEFVPSRDIEISQYPVLSFLIGLSFIGLSIYFVYSVSGGVNSIEGFNNRHWWQYIIALIPSLFGFFFLFTCETQTVIFSRKDNYIKVERKYFCCIYASDNTQKEFSDLVGISVVNRGTQKVNISTATYYIVLSFKTCEQTQILGCKSSIKILQYFQQIRKMFSTEQISHKKVVIQNMLDS